MLRYIITLYYYIGDEIIMNKYRNLLRRVAYLESLLYEGKQDQENLL